MIVSKFVKHNQKRKNCLCCQAVNDFYEEECEAYSGYSLKYVRTVVNLCEQFDQDMIKQALTDVCGGNEEE